MTTAIERMIASAAERGIQVDVEPVTRFCARLRLADGRTHMLIGADLGLNTSSARRVADDKAFCAHFVELDGLRAVTSRVIGPNDTPPDDLTYPVVVKPNRGFGGDGVLAVSDARRLARALESARRFDSIALIQPMHTAPEYRVIVVGDTCVAAYKRERLEIRGDGQSTLAQLLAEASSAVGDSGEDVRELELGLWCQGISLDDVPEDGERIHPLIAANLKRGGAWRECLELDDHYRKIALSAAAAVGLTVAGVDMFVTDAANCGSDYAILEVNANPGFEYLRQRPDALDAMIERVWSRIDATR